MTENSELGQYSKEDQEMMGLTEKEIRELSPAETLRTDKNDVLDGQLKITPKEDRMDEVVLEELGHFSRTETELFTETNHNLEVFTREVAEKFSNEDQKEIYDALMLMFTLHIYQKDRPEGSPYVSHPLAVAQKAISMAPNPDKDLVIAALMHDTIEDQSDKLATMDGQIDPTLSEEQKTLKSLAEVQNKYGERVASIVSHLSNPDFDAILESQGITKDNPEYKNRKNELYANHVAESIEDPDVLIIKLADFSENALKLSNLPEGDRKQKLIAKYVPVMKIFVERLQRNNLFPEYQEKLIIEYNKFIN